MSRMNKIKEIQRKDGYAVVEPGVICQTLNNALAPTHFFPPDPGSATIASIGGMVSTNASGNRAIKYGTTKDYIMGIGGRPGRREGDENGIDRSQDLFGL